MIWECLCRVVMMGKKSEQYTERTQKDSTENLQESLKLLIDRSNPMADAAEKALERL